MVVDVLESVGDVVGDVVVEAVDGPVGEVDESVDGDVDTEDTVCRFSEYEYLNWVTWSEQAEFVV